MSKVSRRRKTRPRRHVPKASPSTPPPVGNGLRLCEVANVDGRDPTTDHFMINRGGSIVGVIYVTNTLSRAQAEKLGHRVLKDPSLIGRHPKVERYVRPAAPKLPAYMDRASTMDLIVKAIRNHLPPNHPVRFDLAEHLSLTDANGDHNELETPQAVATIIAMFRAMAVEEQQRILNGWNPKVLDVDPAELKSEFDHNDIVPAIWLQSGLSHHRRFREEPIAEFSVMESDTTIDLFIRAGSTKAEALKALDDLMEDIDRHWDRLISDPLNKGLKGGTR